MNWAPARQLPPWLSHTVENSIVRAICLSLLLHLALVGAVEWGRRMGWWESTALPRWLSPATLEEMKQSRTDPREIDLVFVPVDPLQAVEEPPPNETRFYSSRNARAANSSPPELEWNLPQIDGAQDEMWRAVDTPRPLQTLLTTPELPSAPPKEPVAPDPLELLDAGNVLAVKPVPETEPRPVRKETRERPRTLAEARRQMNLAGERVRQKGGVRRHSVQSSFDVRATTFGEYDEAVIMAIQSRWYSLLDQRDLVRGQTGRVVLEFRLNYDGRISQMRVAEKTVSEILAILCQRAVEDPAPYAPWPSEMRRLVGKDYREVRFTFYYR